MRVGRILGAVTLVALASAPLAACASYGDAMDTYLRSVRSFERPPSSVLCPTSRSQIAAMSPERFREEVVDQARRLRIDLGSAPEGLRGSSDLAVIEWTTRDGSTVRTEIPVDDLRICPVGRWLGTVRR